MSTVLLHGALLVSINEARSLPNEDKVLFFNKKDKSDPYVVLEIGKAKLLKSAVILDDLNPKWFEKFRVDVAHETNELVFHIKDKDVVGSKSLGMVKIRAAQLLQGPVGPAWFDVETVDGRKNGASLNLSVQYSTLELESRSSEISDCYFDTTSDNKVTLYQDAHTLDNELMRSIVLSNGNHYTPTCAWMDISEALNGARILIYVTGWSVYANVILVRDSNGQGETLGDLLRRKARDGVRVLILIWDEKLSTDITPGLMGTHDNETAMYFHGSGVQVVLAPRHKTHTSYLQGSWISTCFSHHQKAIIVDSSIPPGFDYGDNQRRLVAFLGGLDLTDGRWDTQQHSLFSTINTYHKYDFYQRCFTVNQSTGPREPWHDVHSKIEGPAARDVLENFEERWQKQAKAKGSSLIQLSDQPSKLQLILDCPAPLASAHDKWRVQLLRSINSDSAKFLSRNLRSLLSMKGKQTDDSIHRAYVHHIRRAKKFIYIENQYFIGSSHQWLREITSKARNLIPYELAKAICNKIQKNERFAAYVVLPMFPEGDPHSAAVQEVLDWQCNTMEMIYKKIANTIKSKGIDALPTDYLNFYCLGNREADVPSDLAQPPQNSFAAMLRNSRRHMIYVHSKMMIVDDEIIILGSANINQRSMGGNRDTEIAICAFQPYHTIEYCNGKLPRSDIYGFRMALWAEHTNQLLPVYNDPSSLASVHAFNNIAQTNWQRFSDEKVSAMDGHLMSYPLLVHSDGVVTTLASCPYFPDTTAPIMGKKSGMFPLSLTT